MPEKKQEILNEIRRVAESVSPQALTQRLFAQNGRVSLTRVSYAFGSFNRAVEAAGLKPNQPGLPVTPPKTLSETELLEALGELWHRVGRRPTEMLMNSEGRFSVRPYRKKWGTFRKAVDEYVCKYGEPKIGQAGSQSQILDFSEQKSVAHATVLPEIHKASRSVARKAHFFGEPMDFRGLRYAPVNEQGVVYLFGMISREMGFLIESIRTDYPDCEGKRMVDANGTKWQHVRIEFEFRSSNFKEHGHKAEDTDLVVCWIHDWPECPTEVLELKSNVKLLPKR